MLRKKIILYLPIFGKKIFPEHRLVGHYLSGFRALGLTVSRLSNVELPKDTHYVSRKFLIVKIS